MKVSLIKEKKEEKEGEKGKEKEGEKPEKEKGKEKEGEEDEEKVHFNLFWKARFAYSQVIIYALRQALQLYSFKGFFFSFFLSFFSFSHLFPTGVVLFGRDAVEGLLKDVENI